jgi:hypothetical protein
LIHAISEDPVRSPNHNFVFAKFFEPRKLRGSLSLPFHIRCESFVSAPFVAVQLPVGAAREQSFLWDVRHRTPQAAYPEVRAGLRCSPHGLPLPYLALLQVGFAMPSSVATDAVRSYRTVSPLPASLPTLRRFTFCCTFRGLAPPRRYLAPCPPSPDFPPRFH